MSSDPNRLTDKWGMRQVRLFGRFFVCPMTDTDERLRITRLGDGDDDICCHFFAGWTYWKDSRGGGKYAQWAFRGCTAYGARAVRICRKAYRNRKFEVDMELTPSDFIHPKSGERIQWHRVLAIDGPLCRTSNVKEFYSEEEIAEYRASLKKEGYRAPTIHDPATAPGRPGTEGETLGPPGSAEDHQEIDGPEEGLRD